MPKTNHQLEVVSDLTFPVKPLKITAGAQTVLNSETLRVSKNKDPNDPNDPTKRDPDTIRFESTNDFSVFFPNLYAVKNNYTAGGNAGTLADQPISGGYVFNAGYQGGKHSLEVEIDANALDQQTYEYYVTEFVSNQVYTDDPDIYVDGC